MTDIRSRCVYEISTDTRPIVYRSLDRLAAEYRPTLDRQSTDSRPTLDRLSVDSPPTVDRISVDHRPTIDRLSTDYRSTIDRYIDRLSTDIAVDITSPLPTVNMIQYLSDVIGALLPNHYYFVRGSLGYEQHSLIRNA